MDQTTPDAPTIDFDNAISMSDIGLSGSEPEDETPPAEVEAAPADDVPHETSEVVATPEAPESTAMPQSWAKETQELWAKTPPEVQKQILHREKQMLEGLSQYKEHNEFGRKIKEIATPYNDYLAQQGVSPEKAFEFLLGAQYRLAHSDQNTKMQMIKDLARGVGIDLDQIAPQNPQNPENEVLKQLQNEINGLKSTVTAREQAEFNQTRQKVTQDVTKFADEHPYFDEVSNEIAVFIKAGADLKSAYDQAVWANPVTRAKEIARVQTEHEAKLKSTSKEQVQKAVKATSSNVRSRDTGRTPTAPLGTMEDTMREVLAERKARTH